MQAAPVDEHIELTTVELAARWKVNRRTILNHTRSELLPLPYHMVGTHYRYVLSEAERWREQWRELKRAQLNGHGNSHVEDAPCPDPLPLSASASHTP